MEAVEITVKVDESRLEDYQKYAQDFGVLELSISKPIKFEELGLAAIDDGQYQCLACSKTFKGKDVFKTCMDMVVQEQIFFISTQKYVRGYQKSCPW